MPRGAIFGGVSAALLLALLAASPPPALGAPGEARRWAEAHARERPGPAADVLRLSGDPAAAAAILGRLDAPSPAERWVRADALARSGDLGPAAAELDALAASAPDWAPVASARAVALRAARPRARLGELGRWLFAFAAALLGLGGARSLLRPRRETAVLALGALGLGLGAGWGWPPLVGPATLLGAAILVLGHAAVATVERSAPGLRARLFLLVLFGLGGLGAALAVGALVPAGAWPRP